MKASIAMTPEDRFQVDSWWATSPSYVVAALSAQLRAAAVVWPELEDLRVGTLSPEELFPEIPKASTPSE